MKDLIRILLMVTIGLFLVGNCKAQDGISPNGEFWFNYLDEYTVKTRFDTINVGKHELFISDEGHLYEVHFGKTYYISEPFYADDLHADYGFMSYTKGILDQLMHIEPEVITYHDFIGGEDLEIFRTKNTNFNFWIK